MANIQVGDVVQLKSGGPIMTVHSVNVGITGENVFCVWFVGTKQQGAAFHPDTLHKITDLSPISTG